MQQLHRDEKPVEVESSSTIGTLFLVRSFGAALGNLMGCKVLVVFSSHANKVRLSARTHLLAE